MAITFDQFVNSIVSQESGGNYSAVSPAGALGKYQIMPGNVPAWSRRYLGFSITPQQFMANPAWQDKIGRGKLYDYWQSYGARGAAAAWYSGDPSLANDYSPQNGGPSIGSYVDSVISRAGGMPNAPQASSMSSALTAGGGGAPMLQPSKTYSEAELMANYGYAAGFFNQNPELKALIQQAVQNQWLTPEFQARLRNTNWFKTTQAAMRLWQAKITGDPATAQAEINEKGRAIQTLAFQLGVGLSSPDAFSFARYALSTGMSEEAIKQNLLNRVQNPGTGDKLTGQLGQVYNQMQDLAYAYGVTPDQGTLFTMAKQTMYGWKTPDDWKKYLETVASSKYPGLEPMLKTGMTVKDIATPYVDEMSKLLEIDPNSVDIRNDSLVNQALQYRDPSTGQPAGAPMELWKFQDAVRQDPRWLKTDNAQYSAMGVARQVLSDMGLVRG